MYTASYKYILDNRAYIRPLQKMAQQQAAFSRQIGKTRQMAVGLGARLKKAGDRVTGLGGVISTAGAGLALGSMYKQALGFETSMNRVEAVTGTTNSGMLDLRNTAKKLGRETQFSMRQVGQGMTYLGTAGLKQNDILALMPDMLDLAAAGQLDLGDAADIATNVLAGFGLELSQITHLSDGLAYAAANSNTTIYQMSGALKNAAATANAAGVSFDETASFIMLLANAGIKGEEAGTQLMNAFRATVAMPKKSVTVLRRLGIDPRSIINEEGKIRNFTKFIDNLGKKGATLQDLFKIFDIRGARAAMILEEAGTESIKKFTANIKNANGAAKKMAAVMMKGIAGVDKRFRSVLEGLSYTMMTFLLPPLTIIVTKLSNFLEYLQKNNPLILKFAAFALVAGFALGVIVIPLGLIASALGTLLPLFAGMALPLTIGTGAITALLFTVKQWTYINHPLLASIKRLIVLIKTEFISLLVNLTNIFGGVSTESTVVAKSFHFIGNAISAFLITPLEGAVNLLSALLGSVTTVFGGIYKILTLDFKGAWKFYMQGAEGVADNIKNIGTALKESKKHSTALFGRGEYAFGETKLKRSKSRGFDYPELRQQDLMPPKEFSFGKTGMAKYKSRGFDYPTLRQQDLTLQSSASTKKEQSEVKIIVQAEPGTKVAETTIQNFGQNFAVGMGR